MCVCVCVFRYPIKENFRLRDLMRTIAEKKTVRGQIAWPWSLSNR